VFNNAQTGIPQGNQQHGKSSIFFKMTAKMFIEIQYHWEHSDLTAKALACHVIMQYLFQSIPSPMGRPRYELLDSKPAHFAIEHYNDKIYAPIKGADFTGRFDLLLNSCMNTS
jgi:hypothetical protein